MRKLISNRFRLFRRDENGAALMLEFVIFVPLLFTSFLMAVEMSVYTMRSMMLDRGTDIAVRAIRLNTGTPQITHDWVKQTICNNSGWLEECNEQLKLEMVTVNPRDFHMLDQTPDCVDVTQNPDPVRGFALGQQHEMMIMRACVRFKPVFPTSGLGRAFEKDSEGRAKMISITAFVQEPN
jgi:hypothetical protein